MMDSKLAFDLAPDEIEIFLADVNNCLQMLERGLLDLEQKADPATLNAIFRAAHTLKALAGTVGHQPMVELTHTVETLFDGMRAAGSGLSPAPALIDTLLATVDALKILRDEIVERQPGKIDITELLTRLNQVEYNTPGRPSLPLKQEARISVQSRLTPEQTAQAEVWLDQGYRLLEIDLMIQAETFAPAARLYQAMLALMEVGQIVAQQPTAEALGEEDKAMWLLLATRSEPDEVKPLLADITDLAEYHLSDISDFPNPATLSEATPVPPVLATISDSTALDRSDGMVRISTERLDKLLNLVGELVTNRTRLLQIETMIQAQYGKNGAGSALSQLTPHFSHVISQLQEEVMHARMLPIAHLFNKFPRLARELARQEGKQVKLLIEGETTELDRAVIEAIGDPLLHLLRNAIAHGIETPEVRLAAGKPAEGSVRLAAAAVEGQIVISVSDDGGGIDPKRIRQAAISRDLLSAEEAAQLSDEEAIELIFRPNLSTAAQVTEVSGRGVGMDVVRTNIERLSGSVTVTSEIGQGVTFRLTLPLTLALVQTMLVTVRDNLYALPVAGINGALYLAETTIQTVKGKPSFDWQGVVLPLLDLREFFIHPRLTARPPDETNPSIVLVTWGKLRVGLLVDKIIGQQEIVVKALSPLLGHTPGLSGATILGDGQIAFIVDIPGLLNTVLQSRR